MSVSESSPNPGMSSELSNGNRSSVPFLIRERLSWRERKRVRIPKRKITRRMDSFIAMLRIIVVKSAVGCHLLGFIQTAMKRITKLVVSRRNSESSRPKREK